MAVGVLVGSSVHVVGMIECSNLRGSALLKFAEIAIQREVGEGGRELVHGLGLRIQVVVVVGGKSGQRVLVG